jgi:AcrR family transcriptional regulator
VSISASVNPETPASRRTTRSPRTGRRPGPDTGTRTAIIDAAGRLFLERGYEQTSMRAIGAAAGVDAALVTHFFGSKANLLATALHWPFDPDVEVPRLLSGGPDHVGRRLVRLITRTWDEQHQRNPILTLLRAATSEPRAAELLGTFLKTRLFDPLLAALGSNRPELRSELAISQLAGLAITRYILHLEPLATAPPHNIVNWIGPTIQRYLTDEI